MESSTKDASFGGVFFHSDSPFSLESFEEEYQKLSGIELHWRKAECKYYVGSAKNNISEYEYNEIKKSLTNILTQKELASLRPITLHAYDEDENP
ncbi:hypothetical protein [Abyssalbus ytuae]|uniref:Uncharacterized protein n=1 Tax=Abyssalbus ytuae TaxID=2926907 RepID=A0A9E6ZV31_9FLAO|nr:hypothetical protein [Abyssalbus ytuae]UOB18328.1 hypothetical protein MQE35_03335 [Abyssalbus ytuae]